MCGLDAALALGLEVRSQMHARHVPDVEPRTNASLARSVGPDCRRLNRKLRRNVRIGTDEREMLRDHQRNRNIFRRVGLVGLLCTVILKRSDIVLGVNPAPGGITHSNLLNGLLQNRT